MHTPPAISARAARQPWGWFAFAAILLLTITALQDCAGLSLTIAPKLRVFGAFWASGWAAAHGLNPFLAYALSPASLAPGVIDVNLSPPALLPLFAGLSYLNPLAAAPAWIMAQALCVIAANAILLAAAPTRIKAWQTLWMLLLWLIQDAIFNAQDYAILYLCVVLAWVWLLSGKPHLAGIFSGLLVAAKPNFALWPALLLMGGYWRPALTSAAVALIASALPSALYGPHIYLQWLHAAASDQHWMLSTDISFYAVCARFGVPVAGRILAALLVLAACLFVWWKKPQNMPLSALALAAAILAAPLAWADYAMFLLPAFIHGLWTWRKTLAAILLSIPLPASLMVVAHPGPHNIVAWVSLIYPLALLLIIREVTAPAP